jgi:nicotinamidase-related amidase
MLFAIDLQNDYLDPAGKFYFPQVEEIKQAMRERLEQACAKGELIAYTKNIYPEDEYAERSASEIAWAEEIHEDFKPLLATSQKFEKIHYGIAPEGALKFRDEFADRKKDFEFIEFIGVETNVCVLSNISIVQNIFPESGLMISPRRTAANDDTLYKQALAIMRGLKVKVLDED